jgi:hypothetical protein
MNCNVKYFSLSKLLLFLLWLTNTLKRIVYTTCFIGKVNAICRQIVYIYVCVYLWSEFLATDTEIRVRFPALREKKVVGLEWGPRSLVSTTEELLGRKSSGSGLESRE